MSLDRNLDDLRRHAADFAARSGFTFTVVGPVTGDVIGCVYLYPSESPDAEVTVRSWVRASHAELDVPLADAVAAWLAAEWPWERVYRPRPLSTAELVGGDACLTPTDTNEATTNASRQRTPRIWRSPSRSTCRDGTRSGRQPTRLRSRSDQPGTHNPAQPDAWIGADLTAAGSSVRLRVRYRRRRSGADGLTSVGSWSLRPWRSRKRSVSVLRR
jgi:hypothetical protein